MLRGRIGKHLSIPFSFFFFILNILFSIPWECGVGQRLHRICMLSLSQTIVQVYRS